MEILLLMCCAAVIGCLSALAGQAHEARKWERRLLERGALDVLASRHARPADDVRLDRLEQMVETIATEMERVSEGQRFVTKLMTERKSTTPRSPLPGSVQAASTPT